VGSSLIVVGICPTKVVFACVTVNHTIPMNKYLFQNGRLLLTCIVLLSPTLKFFYTSRGGGLEAPIRRMARWGLLANRHETSLKNFNFNPRVCFLRLLLRGLYGPTYVKQILKRG
jgi:hypothetical protein